MKALDYRRIFPKGSTICSEGEVGDCAYIIERGQVEISTVSDSEKVVLATQGPGEIFGEMAIVDHGPRSATVTALEETELNLISRERLETRLQHADPVVRMVLSLVLERFRATLDTLKRGTSDARRPLSLARLDSKKEVQRAGINRIRMEQELGRAIERDELVLYYQPLVDFASERIAGFEALVRWRHPELGLILPVAFLDVAEESGLIVELGQWVLNEACRALHALNDRDDHAPPGSSGLFMSVNVSARELCRPGFVENLKKTIQRCRIDPKGLKLEVTESLLVENPELARRTLECCVSQGTVISIDDFGTGYSSLAYLHKFPIETIKIDRSFVVSMFKGEGSLEIIKATIGLAQALGMATVAEGIDNEAQEAILRRFGCIYGQGYLYAKPMPLDEATALIKDWGRPKGAETPPPVAPAKTRLTG